MLPEVVFLAESHDVRRVDAYFIFPDAVRLVVVFVDGRPEELRRDLEFLRQEFPCPRDCLVLEVIAEGEVAEHLEECAVARGVTDAVEVGGADALLTGGDAAARRDDLAGEELLHRRHAGVYEKK